MFKFVGLTLFVLTIFACGGGGGAVSGETSLATGNSGIGSSPLGSDGRLSDTQGSSITLAETFAGRVAMSPMAGAVLFVDVNGNSKQDENEPSAMTDDDGLFRLAPLILPAESSAKVVSVGGMDMTTGQSLPLVVLTAQVPKNFSESVYVTELTTMLASADGVESQVRLLAAMKIGYTPLEVLTRDGWLDLAAGDEGAMHMQRMNRQLSLLQQSSLAFAIATTGLKDRAIQLTQGVAKHAVRVVDREKALDLTSAEVVQSVLQGAFVEVFPEMAYQMDALVAVARSVATLNAVIADPDLDPRSEAAANIARVLQGAFLEAVAELAAGRSTVVSFTDRTRPRDVFLDMAIPPDAADTDFDGLVDAIDPDNDGDDVNDALDAFPTDPGESQDTDEDGIGNNADSDDDNDGVGDDVDAMPLDRHVHTMPTTKSQYLDLQLLPKARNELSGMLTSTSQDNRQVLYRITAQPVHGSVVLVDAGKGLFSYATEADTVQSDSFSYVANDGYVDSAPSTVYVSLRTDPLYKHQWSLANTGQDNFAHTGGRVGADMNVSGAVVAGYTGKGVVLAVVDTGLEIGHEDLVDNVVAGSYDFVDADTDPTPTASSGDHGTAVAGIAAATGWNDIGLRGIAPGVSLKGFNWLMSQSTANWISTFGGEEYSKDVDIFNSSWGSASRRIDDPLKNREEATFNETLPAMRGGKGAIFVKSAGNDFNANSNGVCGTDNGDGGLSCRDANQDSTHNNPNIIVVGSLNADGSRSSYSTVGSAIWVSAPGGENGSGDFGGKPALMTTDIQGCTKGYVGGAGDGSNAFNSKDYPHSENGSCNYTSTMNGTSAAAPNVSGAIALMLEANPQLTMRDIKHILAETSEQVEASIAPVLVDGIPYHAWVINSAGYTFHNYFGFGGIDVTAAVSAATNYTLGSLRDRSTLGWISTGAVDLDVGFGATVTQALNVNTVGVVEHVLVRLTMTHADPSEVGFRLTSPSGTTTTIWQPYAVADTAIQEKRVYLSANAFYGESMAGDWTLNAYDHKSGNSMTLHAYEIKFQYR